MTKGYLIKWIISGFVGLSFSTIVLGEVSPNIQLQEKEQKQRQETQSNNGKDVPKEVKEALAMLSKENQPKFFGAYIAGFTIFKVYADDWFLAKTLSTRDNLREILFLGSLKDQRLLKNNQKAYRSLISELTVDCEKRRALIEYVEFKEEAFGTGETVWSVRLPEEKKLPDLFRKIQNNDLNTFILHMCSL